MPLYNSIIGAKNSAAGITSNPTTTSDVYVIIPEMSVTLVTNRNVLIKFEGIFSLQNNDDFTIGIHLDEVLLAETEKKVYFSGGNVFGLIPTNITPNTTYGIVSLSGLTVPSEGSHIYDVRWKSSSGVAKAIGTQRQIEVIEIF